MVAMRLGRDVAVYGLASLLTQAAVVVATPVFARYLGPAGYGELDLLMLGVNLLVLVALAGTETAALQQFYVAKDGRLRQDSFSTAALWTLAAGLILGGLALSAAGPLSQSVFGLGALSAVRTAALVIPVVAVARLTVEALRARRKPWLYLLSVGILSGLQMVLGVALVVGFDGGVTAVMVAWLIAAIASTIFNVSASRQLFVVRFSRSSLRPLLKVGVPLLFAGLAGWSVMFVDRLILVRYVTLSQIGVYALAAKVSLVLTLVIYAFNRGWTPIALEAVARDAESAREMRARTSVVYLAAVAWVAVAASLLAPLAVDLVGGQDYSEAADLIPVLATAFLLFAPMPLIQVSMLVTERTALLALPAVIAAGVNAFGVIVLAGGYGLTGAAWATVAGFLLQLVVTFAFANRIDPIPYPWGKLFRLGAISIGFLALSWMPTGRVWDATRCLLTLTFPAFLVLAGVVARRDLRRVLSRRTIGI